MGYTGTPSAPTRGGQAARIVEADITQADGRRRLLDAAPSLYGLVVLAGDPARAAAPEQMEEAMERSHRVNYLGPVLLAREAAARMQAAGMPGAIVLIGTMQAVALFPGSTAYAGAKAALVHAARILAKECRGPAQHPGERGQPRGDRGGNGGSQHRSRESTTGTSRRAWSPASDAPKTSPAPSGSSWSRTTT